MSATRHSQDDWEVSPPERLDEAFAVARALPASALVWCVLGPAPLVLGLLCFWSDLTGGGRPVLTTGAWAAVLTALYGWLKVTQAFFARAVWARLLPEGGLPVLTWGGWFRRTGALLALAAVALPFQAMAALLVLPFAWAFAFFQHATVLAYTHDLEGRAWRHLVRRSARLSIHEPLAHHFSLLMLIVLAGLVWGAVLTTGLVLPFLVKILTGVESEFTRNPLAVGLSTLYLSLTVSVAWMIISPYFRVAYVLRTFQIVSRSTGDDLLGRLEAVRRRAAAVAVLFIALALPLSPVGASEANGSGPGPSPAGQPAGSGDPGAFSDAIRSTLAGRDYQWRLPPAEGAAGETEPGLITAVKEAFAAIGRGLREIDRLVSEASRAVRRLLGGDPGASSQTDAGGQGLSGDALRGVVYLVGTAALSVVLVFLWRRARRRGRPSPSSAAVSTAPAGPVDLADDTTLASALPEDEWLRLARARAAEGDLRLAVRAAFLATLASLGEQRLIDIARSKSNRDYAQELRIRAAARREAPEVFGRSVRLFECAWYGCHEVAPDWVRELLDNHQRLASRVPFA